VILIGVWRHLLINLANKKLIKEEEDAEKIFFWVADFDVY